MSPFLDDSFPEISGIWPEETEYSRPEDGERKNDE